MRGRFVRSMNSIFLVLILKKRVDELKDCYKLSGGNL